MYFGKLAEIITISGSGINYVCLDKEDGIEVSNRDINAYAEAMVKLADNEELNIYMSNNSRNRIKENFLTIQFVDRIRTAIGSL